MKKAYEDVKKFHDACGVPVRDEPGFPDKSVIQRRLNLIVEEFAELMQAQGFYVFVDISGLQRIVVKKPSMNPDIVEVADAIGDLIYVLIGTALEYGIPLPGVWDEIQRSNMTKPDPLTGKALMSDTGKIPKGDWFEPPDLKSILFKLEKKTEM